jgi:integrase
MATPRRLTNEYIAGIPVAPLRDRKPTYLLHPDVGRGAVSNLRLRVTSGGAKAWVLSARFPSKPRNPTLRKIGEWPAMPLDEARDIAIEWNQLIKRKIDPQEHAQARAREERAKAEAATREEARRKAGTFASAAENYITRWVSKLRTENAVARVIRQDLIKRWGKLPVTEISKTDVIELLEDMERMQGTYAAHRAFAHARALFTWLLLREDPKRPTLGITANPCIGVDPNAFIKSREPRQRIFTPSEIRLIWQATEGEPTATYPIGSYVRLLLILGCRRNELVNAMWPEFDLDAATWKLVETRVKNNETRTVPLPGMALDILRALPRFAGGPYIFTASGGRAPWTSYDAGKKAVDRRITAIHGGVPISNWRYHDLRRTMRTNLSAIPTISPIVAELAIGHRQQGLLKVYDQHKYESELRDAFERWCARLRSIVDLQPNNNIVALRA